MTTCIEKELVIRFTVRVFFERLSICVWASLPFGFEGGMWELILLTPDPYLLSNFVTTQTSLLQNYEQIKKERKKERKSW